MGLARPVGPVGLARPVTIATQRPAGPVGPVSPVGPARPETAPAWPAWPALPAKEVPWICMTYAILVRFMPRGQGKSGKM